MAIFFRGSTAYEFQIGRLCVRWTHLKGKYWSWRPWRRFKVWIEEDHNGD